MNNELLNAAKDEAAREIGYKNFGDVIMEEGELNLVINRAMEIYASKQQAYWEQRCKLAEIYFNESPCDPDITKEQLSAWHNYQNFIKTTKP